MRYEREREIHASINPSFLVGGLRCAAQTRPLPTHLPGLPPLSLPLPLFQSLSSFSVCYWPTTGEVHKADKKIWRVGWARCALCCGKRSPFAVFTGDVEREQSHRSPRRTAPCLLCSAQPAASRSGLWSTQDVDQNAIAYGERAWHRECKCCYPETPVRYRMWERDHNDRGSGYFAHWSVQVYDSVFWGFNVAELFDQWALWLFPLLFLWTGIKHGTQNNLELKVQFGHVCPSFSTQ